MSKVLDERVVSLQFDNREFEKNVSTTMGTLEKFKQKLNFKGTASGLEEVGRAAGKVDMSGLGKGVEAVQMKFSAMQVAGMTAIANITNSAVNAGKRIASALTIDPIKTGFQEYETQINAVQTILANTKSKGSTLDDVNKALDKLNEYADQTIYNFTEMTRNIGTFTAAGVDLETSTNAIQGIANLAAVSGSSSQQASTAMYQLSQALAAGKVSLMDWNSVVNAGMGGQLFQDALIETSERLKTGAKAEIEKAGSFRESLTKGAWLTTDVLTETLKKFTTTGANEYIAEYTGLTQKAVEAETQAIDKAKDQAAAIDQVSEALAKKSGKSKDAIKESLEFAYTAQDAATKVKTFTQLWDVLKESAQSGWTQTWELLVGDFEQAKSLLTPLADFLTGAIDKISDTRNKILGSALTKNFTDLGKRIKASLEPINKTADAIKNVAKSTQDYAKIVNEILGGKWGNGQQRWNKLAKSGYDWAHAQNLVNEKLGSAVRHTSKLTTSQNGATKSTEKNTKATKENAKATKESTKATKDSSKATKDNIKTTKESAKSAKDSSKATKTSSESKKESTKETEKATKAEEDMTTAQKKRIEELIKLSDAELKHNGYAPEQIKALRELESLSKKLNIPVGELLDNLDEINGRWILMRSFKNIFQPFITTVKSFGKAWKATFDPITGDDIFNIIAGFHKISTYLVMDKEAAEDLTNVFKGLFAIIDLVASITGGAFKIGFKIISEVFKSLGYGADDVLHLAGSVGEAIAKFRDWIEEHNLLYKIIEKIVPLIIDFAKGIIDLVEAFFELPFMQKILENIVNGFVSFFENVDERTQKLIERFDKLNDITFEDIGGAFKLFKDDFIAYCDELLNKIDILPDGLVSGFVSGISSNLKSIVDVMMNVGKIILDTVKDYLGIHSPSTKAIEMMGHFIDGIVIGIRNGIQKIIDSAKLISEPLLNIFEGIDLGKLFASSMAIGTLVTGYKFAKAFEALTAPAAGVGALLESVAETIDNCGKQIKSILENVSGVVEAFGKTLKAKAFKTNSQAIVNLAKALLIIAGAVFLISKIDQKKLISSVTAFLILTGALAALAFAVSKFGEATVGIDWKKGIEINGLKASLLNIGIAVLLIAASVKLMSTMKVEEAIKGFVGLGLIIIAIIAVLKIIGQMNYTGSADNLKQAGKMIRSVAITMAIMIGVIKLTRVLNGNDVLPAILFTAYFLIFMTALIGIGNLVETGNIEKLAGSLLSIALSMALMIAVVKLMKVLNKDDIKPALLFAAGFVVLLYTVIGITYIFGDKELAKIGMLMLSVTISMALMIGVIKLISKMKDEDMRRGVNYIVGFGAIMVALVGLLSLVSKNEIAKVGGTIVGMAFAIGIIAGVAILMSYVSTKDLVKGITVVAILAILVAGMTAATVDASDIKGTMVGIAIAIGVLAAAVLVLSFIKPEKLIGPTLALSMLMGMLGLMMKLGSNIQSSIGTLIVMMSSIAVMTAAIMLLSKVPADRALSSAASLSLLMISMGVCMKMLSGLNTTWAGAIKAATGLLLLCVPLLALVGILTLMQNVQNVLPNTAALILLMGSMTLLLIPLTAIGSLIGQALLGIAGLLAMAVPMIAFVGIMALMSKIENAHGNLKSLILLMGSMTLLLIPLTLIGAFIGTALLGVLGLTSMVVPMLAFVGVMALMNKIENAQANGILLIALMTTITNCLVKISLVAPLLVVAEVALLGLIALMGIFATLSIAVAGLVKYFPGIKDMVSEGIPLLISLADGVGKIVGAFIGGAVEQITSVLPNVGTSLSEFSKNIQPFIDSMANVDPKVLDSVKLLAQAMLILTGAELLNGLVAWLTGDASLSDFGTQLAGFSGGLRRFGENVNGIDPEKIKGAATAAKTLAEMASMIPNEGGLISLFTGDNSLDKFGNSLASFAGCLKTFYTNAAGIEPEVVKQAAEAGKSVINMAKEIPNEGGLISFFTGDNTLGAFGNSMAAFGACLRTFNTNVTGISLENVQNGCAAGKAIIDMAKDVPNTGGLISFFTGDNTLDAFGNSMASFAGCLRTFGNNVAGVNLENIQNGCSASKSIIAMAKEIPNEGGIAGFFAGENNMDEFGTNLASFGSGLRQYSNEVFYVDLDAVKRSADVVRQIVDISNNLPKDKMFKKDTIADFGDNLPSLGTSLKKFYNKFKEINLDDTNKAVSAIKNLASIGKHLEGYSDDGLKNFKSTLKNIADAGIKDFTNAFKNSTEEVRLAINTMFNNANTVFSTGKSDFDKRGKELITSLAKGMESCGVRVKLVVTTLSENASKSANSFRAITGFTSAGINMVNGFASGISSQTWKAEAKASAMAQAALDSAKKTLDINSPSKEARKLGFGIPEGLAQGIDRMSHVVDASSNNMANSALNSTGRIISDIAKVIDSDVDYQPTIRPVVDLSSVEAGAGTIGRMLGGLTPSLGVIADVNSINGSMNARLQNGVNDDVVSAIEKLGGVLGSLGGGDTYNINGITYDDGSNITNAVSTLVRAARIERRM